MKQNILSTSVISTSIIMCVLVCVCLRVISVEKRILNNQKKANESGMIPAALTIIAAQLLTCWSDLKSKMEDAVSSIGTKDPVKDCCESNNVDWLRSPLNSIESPGLNCVALPCVNGLLTAIDRVGDASLGEG